jgi:hypothetical protein
VERNVATTVRLEKLDAASIEFFLRQENVVLLGITPQRDNRLVLQQEKHVPNLAFFSQVDELLLDAQPGGVIDSAELYDRNHFRRRSTLINADSGTQNPI